MARNTTGHESLGSANPSGETREHAVNAGPLQNARWLEMLALLNITLGYVVGHGVNAGFRYIH